MIQWKASLTNFSDLVTRIVWFQEISLLPPQKGLEIPGLWGALKRPKNLKQCMKLHWNCQRGWGGGVIGQIPSVGGMDIYCNHTFFINVGYVLPHT